MSACICRCHLRSEHRAPFSFEELKRLCRYVNPCIFDLPFTPPSEGALIELVLREDDLVPSNDVAPLFHGKGLSPLSSDQALFFAFHHEQPWLPGVRVVVCPSVVLPRTDELGETRAIVCENSGNKKRIFFPPSGVSVRGPVWIAGVRT